MPELIGPKPEPVAEPATPTPWSASGEYVYDVNGRRILMVDGSGLTGMEDRAIARLVVEAINEKYGPSKVRYFRKNFQRTEPTFYEVVNGVHTRTLSFLGVGWEEPPTSFTVGELTSLRDTEEVPQDQVPAL